MKLSTPPLRLVLLLFTAATFDLGSCAAQIGDISAKDGAQVDSGEVKLNWQRLPDLPEPLGVAGPFVGVHNRVLILAGGAKNTLTVWQSQKSWNDQIWVLTETAKGWQWSVGGKLRRALGYGATASTSRGVVCIGGNNPKQLFQSVFLLQWDSVKRQVVQVDLPSLPLPLAYGQATAIGEVVYVAGGQSGLELGSAMNQLWSLDLSLQADPAQFVWRVLPALPAQPRAFNITAHQHNGDQDCVYIIGGRYQADGETHFLNDVWEFNPRTQLWLRRADAPRNISAGTGIGFGDHHILVLGGDDGSLFTKTEQLKDEHPGFHKDAFGFNAKTNIWAAAGNLPQNHVTTTAVHWKDRIIIASGEVRPRVRTPNVWSIGPTLKRSDPNPK